MCSPFIIIILSLKCAILLALFYTLYYFVTNMMVYYVMARSSYSTVPGSEMGWRPFILTEVFCCVLYFLFSTGCRRPKRTCSLQYVQGMMFWCQGVWTLLRNLMPLSSPFSVDGCHIPPDIDIYQNRRHHKTEVFNLYKLCSWQRVVK